MPNYYFRVICNGEVLPDDGEPEELPALEVAKSKAIEGAREILSEAVMVGNAAGLDMQIEVHDGKGGQLFSVRVGRVVDADTQN